MSAVGDGVLVSGKGMGIKLHLQYEMLLIQLPMKEHVMVLIE